MYCFVLNVLLSASFTLCTSFAFSIMSQHKMWGNKLSTQHTTTKWGTKNIHQTTVPYSFRFYWGNRTWKVYKCRIAIVISRRCSLSRLLNVCAVESLRLTCILVCGDSASRRWGWFLCSVQIVSIAVWSGCRCCWRRSMMWTHWLPRLDDWCPDLFILG